MIEALHPYSKYDGASQQWLSDAPRHRDARPCTPGALIDLDPKASKIGRGISADIIKLAMLRVDEQLTAKKLATRMVSTVHDELLFEVPEGEKSAVGAMVKETMEGVMKLEVPLLVECGWGKNWGDAH